MPTVTQLWPSGGSKSALGSGAFTNDGNVSVDDSATFATHVYSGASGTFGDKYGNFGLSIPAGVTITQVQIKYQGKQTTASGLTGRIFWNVGASTGSNHDTVLNTTLTYLTFDVTSERAWAQSDFADGTFFISLESVVSVASTHTVSVNALYAIITYSSGAGIYLPMRGVG